MARRRRGGGTINTNQRAVLGYGKTSRPRILRALDPFIFKTLQAGNPPAAATEAKVGISKNVFYRMGHPIVRGRKSVRRLYRRDPYNKLSSDAPPPFATGATVARFAPEAAQVDNVNTNKQFHPEASPGAVGVSRQPQPPISVGSDAAARTHGKVIKPNRQTLLGGKTLRRR